MKPTKQELNRRDTMERQPLWATVGLTLIVLSGIAAIVYVRVETGEIPAGLVAITSTAVTAVVMSAGRRRL
jgi:hypothetical protein